MIARIVEATKTHLREPLNGTAWSLAANTVVTAGLGVIYWGIATNKFAPEIVGRDGALISAMTTLAVICDLNLNNVAQRFLPQVRDRLGLRAVQAYAAVIAFSFVGGALFVLIAPALSGEFQFLRENTFLSIVFPISVALWAVFVLQDSVLIALGKAPWVPVENAIFSLAKIILLPAMLLLASGHGIYYSWIAPTLVGLPIVAFLVFRRAVPLASERQKEASGVVDVFGRRALARFLGQDFIGTITAQVTNAAMPIMVFAIVGAEQSAYFYIPFTLIMAFDALFVGVATSLTTETARAAHRVKDFAAMAMRRYLYIQLPGAVLIFIAAPILLFPFGSEYVENSASVLRILAVASAFRALFLLYCATCRIQGSGAKLLMIQLANAVLVIALVLVLAPEHGITGAAFAWLISIAIVTCALLPSLIRYIKNPTIPVSAGPLPGSA